ncbi:MAG: PAS domain-containing sensor histidine kinase [Ginsengibacter sp.]
MWEVGNYFATNVVLWSDEACRIYGFPTDQNRQSFEAWLSFIHPEDLEFVLKNIKESKNSLSGLPFYYRIVPKDGLIRHIYSESKLEFDSKGNPIVLYGIARDVTEIKRAEKERTKMIRDLMQRNKDLEQFAYIVSHNLRAPVANILGAASGLNYSGLSTEKKYILSQGLNESVTRLDNVIKDLNYILQVKGEINETKKIVSFSKLVDDIKISIKNLIDVNNIKIKYDFSEIDEFLTLKSYLYSIFYNLISNSIKYRQQQVPCIIEIKSYRVA